MNYLLISPQLGFRSASDVVPGGLLQFCRCIARALASSRDIDKLGIWCQVDHHNAVPIIEHMVSVYAHSRLKLDVRAFSNSRAQLIGKLMRANIGREYDRVMYPHAHQAQLSMLPLHPPHDAWLVGLEVFRRLTLPELRALQSAKKLLSISAHTAEMTSLFNPSITQAQVVHLCVEPPLYARESEYDEAAEIPYDPRTRDRAVLIVANSHQRYLYKGHQQLMIAWRKVTELCPGAELWIVGDGDGRHILRQLWDLLPQDVRGHVHLLGRLDADELEERYQRARVFAMPSLSEGFGLVFVEAARHGLPCIGGLYDSVKEVVAHGVTGLLAEQHPHALALACVRLLSDDSMAKRLGQAGRERYFTYFRFPHFQARFLETMGFACPAVVAHGVPSEVCEPAIS